MMDQKRRLRLLVQLACLAVAGMFSWPLPWWKSASKFVSQASPFIAICSSIALRAIGVGTGIGLLFAVIALWRRRWFCRYVCPTGLMLEGAARLGPGRTSWWNGCPPLGKYVALVTAIGAMAGYPIFLWMDPVSVFSSSFSIRSAGSVIAGILAGLFLGILILLSLTSGSFWCARLCPLGGTQDLLASAKSWYADMRKNHLEQSMPLSKSSLQMLPYRRAIILGAAGLGISWWAKRIGAARGENAPLRPPGATAEARFAGICIRCGNCVRTCPSKIIHPDTGEAGIAGLLAPVIRYERQYCLENCTECTQVCPSGAIRALDLKQKQRFVIGEALVNGELCLLALGKKDCDACALSCPFNAIRIYWDEERYIAYPVIDADKCNGCGACEAACPTSNTKAIRVWKIHS